TAPAAIRRLIFLVTRPRAAARLLQIIAEDRHVSPAVSVSPRSERRRQARPGGHRCARRSRCAHDYQQSPRWRRCWAASSRRGGAVALEGQAAEGVGAPTAFPKIPAKGDRRRNDKTSAASPTNSHHHTSSRPIQKNTSARELSPSPGTGETIAWRARRNNSSH